MKGKYNQSNNYKPGKSNKPSYNQNTNQPDPRNNNNNKKNQTSHSVSTQSNSYKSPPNKSPPQPSKPSPQPHKSSQPNKPSPPKNNQSSNNNQGSKNASTGGYANTGGQGKSNAAPRIQMPNLDDIGNAFNLGKNQFGVPNKFGKHNDEFDEPTKDKRRSVSYEEHYGTTGNINRLKDKYKRGKLSKKGKTILGSLDAKQTNNSVLDAYRSLGNKLRRG